MRNEMCFMLGYEMRKEVCFLRNAFVCDGDASYIYTTTCTAAYPYNSFYPNDNLYCHSCLPEIRLIACKINQARVPYEALPQQQKLVIWWFGEMVNIWGRLHTTLTLASKE